MGEWESKGENGDRRWFQTTGSEKETFFFSNTISSSTPCPLVNGLGLCLISFVYESPFKWLIPCLLLCDYKPIVLLVVKQQWHCISEYTCQQKGVIFMQSSIGVVIVMSANERKPRDTDGC